MLTADLVRAYRRKGELVLRRLSDEDRQRAGELAEAYLDVTRTDEPKSRGALREAWAGVPVMAREKRLSDGIQKLVEDQLEFAVEARAEPSEVRSVVFFAASLARQAKGIGAPERAAIIAQAASKFGVDSGEIERSLYADLKGEQVLVSAPRVSADAIVSAYDRGQVQAVLLRAVKVVADVDCRSAEGYRAVFRALKFRRLLHRATRREDGGYRLEIDGPYSLFDSVTKYGLALALVLPELEACSRLALVAEVRWGKARDPLLFRYEHAGGEKARGEGDLVLRDDVAELVSAWPPGSAWRPVPSREILELPGLGVCVPDLVFEHGELGRRVHFEALGFWSRDAVWKRVELVQAGLSTLVLFAVSSRLRVSEAVLDDSETSALYVYKGTMSARAVERKLDLLISR